MSRDLIAFTHGDRVRMGGFDGPTGTVYQCTRRDGQGTYWKVRLDTGEWVWPDGAVADSTGAYEERCLECGLRFRTGTIGEPFCPNCDRRGDREIQRSYARDGHIQKPLGYTRVTRQRRR